MSFNQTLQKMGFSKKEAAVFLTLLENGEMSASQIAKVTKLVRTTVYDILKNLMKEEFVVVASNQGKIQTFTSGDPEKLISYVDNQAKEMAEQKRLIEEKQTQLKELIPQLKAMSDEVIGKPKTSFYDGAKGLVEALNLCLMNKKPVAIYGSLDQWIRWMPDHFEWYVSEAEKRKVDIRRIDQKTIGKLRGDDQEKDNHWPVRFLPVGFTLPGFTIIFGDKIMQASFQRPMATIIEDKEMAASQKTVFELFWQFLRES